MKLGAAWLGPAAILAYLAVTWSFASCGSEGNGNGTSPPLALDGGDAADAPPPTNVNGDSGVDSGRASNPVGEENQRPGTEEWMLASPATKREIEGYASATSVAAGGTIRLFVNTASPRYAIDVYRLGWYGGKGGRLVTSTVERDGRVQVVPPPDADGLVECAWTDPYELAIPADWVTGIYVAKLTTKDTGKQSYIPFVVRDDVRAATYLVQSSVTTFQAYNNWGGKSLYDFNSTGDARASRVSFLRPYALGLNPQAAAGVGAGELITNLQGAAQTGPMGWEYPMVRFLEREGFDVSYVTNVDVHRDAQLVAKHRVFVSTGHDEYWSYRMRDHVEYARDHGATSVAIFSGNVAYWQVRFQPSKAGAPDTTLYCTKDASTDPVSLGVDAHRATVHFRDALVTRGEEGLGGVAFQDYGMNSDLVVHDPSSWIFAGTGLALGATIPGLLGYEVDGAQEPPLPGVRRVLRSPWTTPLSTSGISDAVVRALPSGAETFAAGTIQWAWGLDDHRPKGVTQPNVRSAAAEQVTRNVLTRLAAPRPARNRSPLYLDEAFSGALDGERWSRRTITEGYDAFDPTVPVEVAGGRLTITPRAGVTGLVHGGITTARTFAMTCGSARVELVEATNAASTADTTFAIAVDPGRWYRMTVENGVLALGANDGAVTSATVPYDAVQHRHLRIRHDCVLDDVVFETSADGTSWTARRTIPRTVDLSAAYVEVEAGTFQPEAAPGKAIFDNVRVEVRGVRESFARQRDPEVFTPETLHEGGYDPEMEVFPAGGVLHLRPRAGVAGGHHMGFATTREIDWTGGVASIVVLKAPHPSTEASVSFAIVSQAPGWARFAVSAGKLFFQSELAAVTSGESIAYDPVAHKHLRLRHDTGPDQIVWETSPDGAAWVERRRIARPFPVTALRAEIEGGTYQAEVDPGEVIVDDFLFAR